MGCLNMSDTKISALLEETDKMFHSAVVEGVLLDAKWALDAKRYRAAAILTFCGIDAMASLTRAPDKPKVDRRDFIGWCETFLDFRNKKGPTGIELYGARCGMLHASVLESELSKAGHVRLIGYLDKANEPVLESDDVEDLILLSTTHFVGIFAEGILKSWRAIKSDPKMLEVVRQRLDKLVQGYGVDEFGSPATEGLSPATPN
jgi:hypothetical protein